MEEGNQKMPRHHQEEHLGLPFRRLKWESGCIDGGTCVSNYLDIHLSIYSTYLDI